MYTLRTLLLAPVFVLPPLIAWHAAVSFGELLRFQPMAVLVLVFYLHVSFFCFYIVRRFRLPARQSSWAGAVATGSIIGFACAGAMALATLCGYHRIGLSTLFSESPNRAVLLAGASGLVALIGATHGGSVGAAVALLYDTWRSISEP